MVMHWRLEHPGTVEEVTPPPALLRLWHLRRRRRGTALWYIPLVVLCAAVVGLAHYLIAPPRPVWVSDLSWATLALIGLGTVLGIVQELRIRRLMSAEAGAHDYARVEVVTAENPAMAKPARRCLREQGILRVADLERLWRHYRKAQRGSVGQRQQRQRERLIRRLEAQAKATHARSSTKGQSKDSP